MAEGEIAAWQRRLARETDLSAATVAGYAADARRCAAWLAAAGYAGPLAAIGLPDARAYRDALVAARRTPATVNRALGSLARFLDDHGRAGDKPFRRVERIGADPPAPQALARTQWNAVRRAAERQASRDHGLALALACLLRYAGPRVGEVAALAGADVQLGARRGLLTIRQGKGRVRREVPLVLEAREPLQVYLAHRQRTGAGGHAGHRNRRQRGPSGRWVPSSSGSGGR